MANAVLRRLVSFPCVRVQLRTVTQPSRGPELNNKKWTSGSFVATLGLSGFLLYLYQNSLEKKKRTVNCQSQRDEEPNIPSECNNLNLNAEMKVNLLAARNEADTLVQQYKEEIGTPGLVIAASIDGEIVWSQGYGYADVENNVKCSPHTVMRIASISKSLTATALAKLWQEGKLDLDAPIQQYVPQFPTKTFEGKTVTITSRNLMSHLGGVRHYKPSDAEEKAVEMNASVDNKTEGQSDKGKTSQQKVKIKTRKFKEMYKKEHYDSVIEALDVFKNDPLVAEPDTEYIYTTHGWTLLSAVVEGASKMEFLKYMKKLFVDMCMFETAPEFCEKIIYNRARFYSRDDTGLLVNTPYVDNSYKWAGGGFMSTVGDLIKFGNAMLYSSQSSGHNQQSGKELPGILQNGTVNEMWTENPKTKKVSDGLEIFYGLGWEILAPTQQHGGSGHVKKAVYHSGQAVGGSSLIYILSDTVDEGLKQRSLPKGVVVAILLNLEDVKLHRLATQVAKIFENTRGTGKYSEQEKK